MEHPPLRLAELVGGLSVVSDLGKGLTDGQGLRACVLATSLAGVLDASAEDTEAVFWIGLLRFVGCTATASQMAAALGNELAVSAAFAAADARDLRDVLRGAVASVGRRPDRLLSFLRSAHAVVREHEIVSCDLAQALARDLGLPTGVGGGLSQVFERWDGKGNPGRAKATDIAFPVRIWQVAHVADLVRESGNLAAVAARLHRGAGRVFDPEVVRGFVDRADELLATETGSLDAVLALEPSPHRLVDDTALDAVLEIFGLLADLKAPCFQGHSSRVAKLAADAAGCAGLPTADRTALRRAALVQDVGRVAIPAATWNRPGPLTDVEAEQVRLHPYFTQRALSRVPALAPLVDLAASHHERSDGSGYHRGLAALSPPTALLAAAERYATAVEDRPHRLALSPQDAAQLLRDDGASGRLPADAVAAVLEAAGHPRPPQPRHQPNPLTERERDVLTAVATGLTNTAVAHRLNISAKTVNSHLEHVYAKLRVSTRTAAIVMATRRGWLEL